MVVLLMIGLTIFNLWIYHKMFHVVYLDMGKALMGEIIGAMFATFIEMYLIFTFLGNLISGAGSLFSVIIKVVVVMIFVLGIIAAIWGMVDSVKKANEKTFGTKKKDSNENIKNSEEVKDNKDSH